MEKKSSKIFLLSFAFVIVSRCKAHCARYTLYARKEERRRERQIHKTSSIIVQSTRHFSRSTRGENFDETVLLLRRRRPRRPLFVVVVAKFLLSTSECGGEAVGGKDGDVVARVFCARVLKRPPETRLRRRDAPRAD